MPHRLRHVVLTVSLLGLLGSCAAVLSACDDSEAPPATTGNGDCASVTSAADCSGRPACRWLIPGCSAPALMAAGCFDRTAINCTATSCPAGKSCVRRSINPCAPVPSSGARVAPPTVTCAACGAETPLCL
ncbi:MAG TPA: hypothetical protein VGG33_12210 [Polyangia bacterium]